MTAPSSPWRDENDLRDLVRWAFAAAVVVVVHGAILGGYFIWHQPEEIGDDTTAVSVDLAPIDTTPDADQSDVAPAQEAMIESPAVPQPQEKPPDEPKAEQPPPDDAPSVIPEPVERPPEKTEQAKPPAPVTAERVRGGAPRIAPSWQSMLIRRLQRFKRYPGDAQARNEQGMVLLSFSLDRNGHVLTRRIARSSGYADLDNEVMAMVTRAEPLPAFPASMPQAKLDLTVPIRFSMH